MFVGTYTNVSASSARSHQLYQNANVFGLERSFSSAPKVQKLDICIQRRSRSQTNGRSDLRISARPPTQRVRKSLPPSYSSFAATSVSPGSSRRPALKRPIASSTSDSSRLATRCSSAPVCRPVCSALPLSYEAPASPAPPQCRDPQQCSAPQQRSSAPVFCTPVSTPVRAFRPTNSSALAHRCPDLWHLVAPFLHLVAPRIGTSMPRKA